MKKLWAFLTVLVNVLLTFDNVFASSPDAACGTACGGFLFIVIAFFVINIAILVWVVKDAKARGMGSPIGWLVLVFFTGIIGLIIYFFARPSGELVYCEHCHNKRLKAMAKCPHCGN